MENYTVPLDPETELYCTLHLFRNVQNTSDIRKKVVAGELSCCVLKPALILNPFQVVVAANKAVVSSKLGNLTTKTLYTEVLFNLSISKNISRSLLEFGISDNDKVILVALIHKADNEDELEKLLLNNVKGEKISVDRLSEFTNHELIKKAYKIDELELSVSNLTDLIVSKISCKDFASWK